MQFNITFKTIFEYILKKLVLCIEIRFVSTEKTTRIASRASCSEMSPLFRTTNVSCEHMKHSMINNNINTRDRKTLIGGMSAERMLLATPLLRWYIKIRDKR